MKRFLLIAGDNYYPRSGTREWIGCFETEEEAEKAYRECYTYCDWYQIIDLGDWIGLPKPRKVDEE